MTVGQPTSINDELDESIEELTYVTFPMNYDHMPSAIHQIDTPPQTADGSGQDLIKVFNNLCMSCRAGDIDTVDSLLSTPELNINQVDEWDYSPLILASLCGHTKIVELLLSRGAVCDRDTFQGARCIYGALNDTIRDLLISFDISKTVDMSQPFAGHISSILNPLNQMPTSDILFRFPHINGTLTRDLQIFRLNRFILAARSPYIFDKLKKGGAWNLKTIIDMPSSTNPAVFKMIVDYMYLRTDGLPIDQLKTQDQLVKFAAKLKLGDLLTNIEMIKETNNDKEKAKAKHSASFMYVEKARKDMDSFLVSSIIGNRVVSKLELGKEIDFEEINPELHIDENQKAELLNSSSIPDTIVSVIDADSESIVYLPVHKAIMARSEYFETMFKSDIFLSSQEDLPILKDYEKTLNKVIIDRPLILPVHIPVIQISTYTSNFEVAKIILSFLYHDDVPPIPLIFTIELLFAADELFLDRLKTMCAVNITSNFSKLTFSEFQSLFERVGYSAYDLIRVSWQTRCDKLEQHVSKLIAHNLERISDDEVERSQFCSLIEESASRIQERQDTDTIELIDDIRYYIAKKYSVNDEFTDFEPIAEHFRESDPTYVAAEDIQIYKNALSKYEREIDMIDALLDDLLLGA